MATIAVPAQPLKLGTFATLVLIGAAFWLAGVFILRGADAIGWLSGGGQALMYVLLVPALAPFVPLGPMLAGLPATERLRAAIIELMTAALIDGIVIGFAPWIYNADPAKALACAGALLWGIGVSIVLAMVMQPKP